MTAVERPLAIWDRVIDTAGDIQSPDHARYVLRLGFTPADHARMAVLNDLASAGRLSPAEEAELDDFIHVGYLLARLQSSARVALRQAAGE